MSESSQQPEQAATRKEPAPERKARKEGGWTPKDYVTLTLSILAFIVSAGTAYFNILRVEENVSVAVDFRVFALIRPGGADFPSDQHNLSVSSVEETPIVFVNSGNKSVAVLSASFIYIQTKEGDPRKCRLERGPGIDAQTLFKTDLDPLVLGPNDVIVKHVKITAAPGYQSDNIRRIGEHGFVFPVSDENRTKSKFQMQVCLGVELTTPSVSNHYSEVPIFEYLVNGDGTWSFRLADWGSTMRTVAPWRRVGAEPKVLIKKVGTIFGW
jgi:hypothetical protein